MVRGAVSSASGEARGRAGLRDPQLLASLTLGLVLSGLWTWWGLEHGGFFEWVAYPGAILLFLALATLLLTSPIRVRLRGAHVVAIAALLGYFGWTLLSLLWTPARDLALEDAGRVLIYAVAFLGGLILANLLGRRLFLAVIPYLVSGAVVAVVTLIAVLGVEASENVLDESGTLDYPIGYRNGNAAYFIAVALAALAAGARGRTPAPAGAAAAAVATLCLGLAILSQSRGSVLATAVAVLVLLALCRDRVRLLALIASVAAPLAVATPTLLEPFSAADDGVGAAPELQAAGEATLIAAGVAAGAAMLALFLLGRASARFQPGPRGRLALASVAAVAVLGAGTAFVAVAGSPVSWVSDQFSSRFSEDTDVAGSRFLYSGGRNRTDFWRVSVNAFEENPLIGDGSGSFRKRYALERESSELPLDNHSLPLEALSELGAVGLLLLLVAIGAMVVAGARSARLGPESGALGAVALAAGVYYLAHASIDWMWSFPGLTAPVIALLGSASAAAVRSLDPVRPLAARSAAGLLVLASLALTPLFLSARLTHEARQKAESNPESARDALERAADLNPLADLPYLISADIARRQGNTRAALDALERAREREPDEWVNYALAGQALLSESPRRARRELQLARELNPRETDLDALERQLRDARGR